VTRLKNPHAIALAKLGAQKGGRARWSKLTPLERSDLAKKMVLARELKKTSRISLLCNGL